VGGGQADIGMTSRALTSAEANLYPGMQIIPLAYDSIVVVVNLDNPLKTLTIEDLRSIFSGEIINWKQVGGRDLPITVLEQNNTMLTVFKALVMDKLPIVGDPADILPSNASVRAAVAAEPGAIGILPQNFVDNSLQLLALNGVQPSSETILSKSYPLVRPLYLLLMNEPSAETKAWLDFIFSDEGRQTILLEGLEPVSQ
jgi:phosphate transport system substrate-binding protein